MILEVTAQDLLTNCRQMLGLDETETSTIDDTLLAALLRRSAGIYCPCSRTSLRATLVECLHGLGNNEASFSDRIDAVVEGLIVGGDLLELNDVATSDPMAEKGWVFAAPPSFVVSHSSNVFLVGVVPDQDTFLPRSLESRVVYRGTTRMIKPQSGEELPDKLLEYGLLELSERVWLKAPKPEAAEKMVDDFEQRLRAAPPSGVIEDLRLLDPTRTVRYYRGRWTSPTQRHNGMFVARRPQEYGTPIWCLVALEHGVSVRLLDLPLKKTRWRGCDVAWRLQMALDHRNANSQIYRRTQAGKEVCLEFFSPLPQWFERRLMLFGCPAPCEGSLISYRLPADMADHEERLLQEQLWLQRTEDSD